MEELTEDHVESLKHRRDWVKFDEDANVQQQQQSNNEHDTRVHFKASSGEAAVISVENGPKSTTNGLDEKMSQTGSAVIETTQVHVSLDRHSPPTDPLPSPAPRGSKDQPRSLPSQPIPKAAARSHKSASAKPGSPLSKSPQLDATTSSVVTSSTASVQPGRSSQDRNETTIIQMPLRESAASEVPAEMQSISLADSANGSLATSMTINQVRKNATRQAFGSSTLLSAF